MAASVTCVGDECTSHMSTLDVIGLCAEIAAFASLTCFFASDWAVAQQLSSPDALGSTRLLSVAITRRSRDPPCRSMPAGFLLADSMFDTTYRTTLPCREQETCPSHHSVKQWVACVQIFVLWHDTASQFRQGARWEFRVVTICKLNHRTGRGSSKVHPRLCSRREHFAASRTSGVFADVLTPTGSSSHEPSVGACPLPFQRRTRISSVVLHILDLQSEVRLSEPTRCEFHRLCCCQR